MKANPLMLSVLASVALTVPALADGGAMGAGASFLGSTTALVVDVPEGMVVDSAFKCPYKATKSLAGAFGDENGWKQNIVGAVIGIPTGAAYGVPYGFFKGGKHALTVGWDKPFSQESFVVANEGQ